MGRADRSRTSKSDIGQLIPDPVTPRLAASVIPLRRVGAPFEVLMVTRNSRGMFGNMVVFPGGTVDPEDADPRHAALRELHEETGIELHDVDGLMMVSRWVTPEFAPQRFDTYFYLAEVSDSSEVVIDGDEIVDHAWVSPGDALSRTEAGEWRMILPTLTHLRWLARRASIEEAFTSARGADGRTVIEPRLMEDGSLLPIHMPGEST